jgi:hypothetical protein
MRLPHLIKKFNVDKMVHAYSTGQVEMSKMKKLQNRLNNLKNDPNLQSDVNFVHNTYKKGKALGEIGSRRYQQLKNMKDDLSGIAKGMKGRGSLSERLSSGAKRLETMKDKYQNDPSNQKDMNTLQDLYEKGMVVQGIGQDRYHQLQQFKQEFNKNDLPFYDQWHQKKNFPPSEQYKAVTENIQPVSEANF